MIKQWLNRRKRAKALKQYQDGCEWARTAIVMYKSPPMHVLAAGRAIGGSDWYMQGVIDTCKSYS